MAVNFDYSNVNEIYTDYITKNPSYTSKLIKIDGIIWHDVGVSSWNKTASQWQARWDRPESKNSVHAIVAADKTCIMAPCMTKPGYAMPVWGCGCAYKGGPSFNSSRIQFEQICPSSKAIKYNGSTFTVYNRKLADKQQIEIFQNSIDLVAKLCLYHNIDPLGRDRYGYPTILDHRTASVKYKRASGHADISGDIFTCLPELGLSLTVLRKEVKKRMEEIELEEFFMSLNKEETFNQYMQNWLKKQNSLPADSWAKEDLNWAKQQGLLSGDSSGNLMPKGLMDRETAMAILHRYDGMKTKEK